MTQEPSSQSTQPSLARDASAAVRPNVDGVMSEIESLLRQTMESPTQREPTTVFGEKIDNELAAARLGVGTGLYTALWCKHPPSAAHGLRVALTSSVWAAYKNLQDDEREAIEIAALLHDIGLVGVPDGILSKQPPLLPEERRYFQRVPLSSIRILRSSGADASILENVAYARAWYDGTRVGYDRTGKAIPRGARMIGIVEAFDSMTTNRAFRAAMPFDEVREEMFRGAGTQFDPDLLEEFFRFGEADHAALRRKVASKWLHELDPRVVEHHWEYNRLSGSAGQTERRFEARLLEHMHDGVLFVDADGRITSWNPGAERLTGIVSASLLHRKWSAKLLDLRDEKGNPIGETDCPIRNAIGAGIQSLRRLSVRGRDSRPMSIDCHAIPVLDAEGKTAGAVFLMHDASSEISLEEKCRQLTERVAKDPMTQVGNRAEFDRVLGVFIEAHQQQQIACSLVICDLDHFKQVNDTYGHQAGDEVIKSLAAILSRSCRGGDFVARYGGEEFVVLYTDCDNASAARRADEIRRALAGTPQSWMEGKSVTGSFGVTQLQPGDMPDTMLRRADRALLLAKEQGRNRVVQLGVGSLTAAIAREEEPFPGTSEPTIVLKQELFVTSPFRLIIEKLCGFATDHEATVARIHRNRLRLTVSKNPVWRESRRELRAVELWIDLEFQEMCLAENGDGTTEVTRISATITPRTNRERRGDAERRAQEVLQSLRAYFVASPIPPPMEQVVRKTTPLLSHWIERKDNDLFPRGR